MNLIRRTRTASDSPSPSVLSFMMFMIALSGLLYDFSGETFATLHEKGRDWNELRIGANSKALPT